MLNTAVTSEKIVPKPYKKGKVKRILLSVFGLLLGLIFIFPVYILALNSFKAQKALFLNVLSFPDANTFTLNNYAESFSKLNYLQSFCNSLYITVFSTLLILLISTMAAWVLVRYKTRTSKLFFIIFAISMLIPFQCVMLPLMTVAKILNFLNPFGLIIMYMGFGTSLAIVMLHGFIKNVPEELEEAAVIDGCNIFQLFFIIVVPLLRIILITVAIQNVMWIWNDYLLPSLIINKPGIQTLPLMTYSFFGQYSTRWDLASAGLILCMIPVIVFYLFSQKYIIKGMTEGAIK
ncbi:MAG: carbohydrate ABC transporter permease [Oscillospiraceae bacterium]|nr:carbohydrate ABC transporter permease [Oscillospiraceae bacterium]